MSPTGIAPDRYVYYPGTEALGKDEIRMTACGTGLPAARRGQAASCFLIELGNGDKFLFDLGTGSMANLAAMMIPMDFLTKVFLSHLHTDHFMKTYNWDYMTRAAAISSIPGQIKVHEFDYKAENQVIYQEVCKRNSICLLPYTHENMIK